MIAKMVKYVITVFKATLRQREKPKNEMQKKSRFCVCFLNNVQSSNGHQLSFWKVSVISHSERQKDDFIYSVFTNYRCLFHLKYRCMTPKLSRLIRGFEVNVEFERTINYQSENETPFYV